MNDRDRAIRTAQVEKDHDDLSQLSSIDCYPGVRIRVDYHADHEMRAAQDLTNAYRAVMRQLGCTTPPIRFAYEGPGAGDATTTTYAGL